MLLLERMRAFIAGFCKSPFAVIPSEARDLLFAKEPGLQRLAEGFLSLVMFVAVAFVEIVRTLANDVRADRHAFAAVFARPLFSGGKQLRACSQAALPFRDNQPVHFGANLTFKQRLLAPVPPADDSIIPRVCHEYGMLRGRLDSQQPFARLCGRGRIPELAGKHADPWRVRAFRSPNFQFSMHRSLCHSFFSAIPQRAPRLSVIVSLLRSFQLEDPLLRSRACTAALCNSRSASAAIQRVDSCAIRRF